MRGRSTETSAAPVLSDERAGASTSQATAGPATHTIILADDVRTTLSIGKAFLEAQGMRVFAVSSADQVVDLAVAVRPSLIILDYEMPEMTGDEVCRLLKKSPETASTPVMILSAHEAESVARACIEAGAERFVAKAEGRDGLLGHVAEILGLPQRRHPRLQCQIETGVRLGERVTLGLIHNLSQGGVYLTVNEAISVGEAVRLQFTLPGSDQVIQVLGEIVRSESLAGCVNGYGIQLLEGAEDDLEALRSFLTRSM